MSLPDTISDILEEPAGTTVTAKGWVRTSRFAKKLTFLHLYDGTTTQTLQVVVIPAVDPELKKQLGVGAAVSVTGTLVESKGPEQPLELKCDPEGITVVGPCDPSEYPVQKKEASPEFWRTIPHLRPRAAEYQRIFIGRNRLAKSVHDFFQQRQFQWVHTPLITGSDCEGAGEMFRLTLDLTDGMTASEWHFFGREAYLTVSGQLEVEPFACAFTRVYTFGPTFRAENSQTTRHAAEFWMIEPEIAFASLEDVMDLAEDFIKYIAWNQFDDREEGPAVPKDFARITYTEAMEILEASGRVFQHPIGWGESIQTEHEKYLADEHFGGPVFVTHYPIGHKPFYMRVTDGCAPDRQTVECFDLLVPGVGEIIGGSAREERLDVLLDRMRHHGLDPDGPDYSWYADTRRYGTVPHGGFGLGFERALMWLLGVQNIRDVLPYPRTAGTMA